MTAQIFISHSSKDQKVARTICGALESRGLKCWMADRDVGPGENFQETIVKAIRSAKVMVLVFTSNANNSDEIKKELALASQSRLTIIPIRMEDVVPNEAFAYEFATRQWIDLFADWEAEMERLCARIAAAIASQGDAGPVGNDAASALHRGPGVAAAPPESNELAQLSWRIVAGSTFTAGLLLSDIGVLLMVLSMVFDLAQNYAAGLPLFIVGLPILIVGGGVIGQYEKSRRPGAVVCALVVAVIVALLVMPATVLSIDLDKSALALSGIFATTAELAMLSGSRPVLGAPPSAPNRTQLFVIRLFSVLASSKVSLFVTAMIYAVPTWIILWGITQSMVWLVVLVVCHVGLAAILFATHGKNIGSAPPDPVRA